MSSASLSLLATSVDAFFDFSSNVVLYWLHRKALSLDTSEWPVGGARLETIGNIVYGTALAMFDVMWGSKVLQGRCRSFVMIGEGLCLWVFGLEDELGQPGRTGRVRAGAHCA